MKPKCIRTLYVKALLWLGLLAVAGYVGLSFYALGQGSKILQRGNLIDELLLTSSPIRHFPEHLLVGSRSYYFHNGEPTGRSVNMILIEGPDVDPDAMEKCRDWLIKYGFHTVAGDTAKTNLIFEGPAGRRAEVRIKGSTVTLSVEQ